MFSDTSNHGGLRGPDRACVLCALPVPEGIQPRTAVQARDSNGKGETIVIVDSYGFQGIGQELKTFDKSFNLPPPPHFTILQPEGPIPPFNPTKRPPMVGWAQETSLDVEYAHAMAPGANILLVETPVPRRSESPDSRRSSRPRTT